MGSAIEGRSAVRASIGLLIGGLGLGCSSGGAGVDDKRPDLSGDLLDTAPTEMLEESYWMWTDWRSVAPDENRPSQHHATVALSDAGDRCVAWDEMGGQGRAWVRTFDALGEPHQGPRPMIDCADEGPCRPDVLFAGDTFWVAASNEQGIWLARFDREGRWVMTPRRIATPGEGEILEAPAMAATPDHGVVVVWLARVLASEMREGHYAMRFVTPEGDSSGDVVRVGDSPEGVSVPDVTSLTDGRVAVIWHEAVKGKGGSLWVTSWGASRDEDTRVALDQGLFLQEPRPMITSNEEGALAAVWRRSVDEKAYEGGLRFRSIAGEWGDVQELRPEGEFDKPVLAVSGDVAMVVWDGRSWVTGEENRRVWTQTWSVSQEVALSAPEHVGLGEAPEERPDIALRALEDHSMDAAFVWREIQWGARIPNRVRLRSGVWTP